MSHIWMSHVTHMSESCLTREWVRHARHDSFMCVIRLMHMCDMTHWYVWHDSLICVTWLIHMTLWHVWHDPLICVTWLIHICDMTHSHTRHDSFMNVIQLIYICVTHLTYQRVTSRIRVRGTDEREYSSHHTTPTSYKHTQRMSLIVLSIKKPSMGWLRLVGSIKL